MNFPLRLRHAVLLPLALAALAPCAPAAGPVLHPRTVEEWLAQFPESPAWEKWLRAQPAPLPDIESLPATAGLPDPLRFADGRPVRAAADWPARRAELLPLFEHYTTGKMPPPPASVRVADFKETREGDIVHRTFALEFGPAFTARLRVELFVPTGRGPFPVFLTQANHRGWALVAASRGYVGCVYAGADLLDDTPTFSALWPDSDASLLTRRAWAGSRCIDHLLTLPEVNRAQIAIAGHSRNGKQSLIAGAFDDRIAAVVSSSSGAGGTLPARLVSETHFGEGIEVGTRRYPQWYHPRLRFFTGRENRLPIDQHELIACIAPRACLISTGINDGVENVWAIEQSWREARRAFALFQREDALQLRYRPGGHETRAEDIEGYVDWLDGQFGRAPAPPASTPIYPTYADWLRLSGERIDPAKFPVVAPGNLLHSATGQPIRTLAAWQEKRTALRSSLAWTLGDPVPLAVGTAADYGKETDTWATLLLRDVVPAGVQKTALNFGGYLTGDLYRPTPPATPATASPAKKLPAIIWLHPLTVAFGYVPSIGVINRGLHFEWAKAGFAVLAFDQIGTGRRVEEVSRFYVRHPHASILGRTVADTRAAVDALLQQDFVDPQRIYVIGHATGAMAALYAAALDERIAGVITTSGFVPMRTDTADKGTGGLARWTHWLPLLPRLGAFVGHEDRLPVGYDEVLALIAPRPVALLQPTIDYQSTLPEIRAAVTSATEVYTLHSRAAPPRLVEVQDYNRYARPMADAVLRELSQLTTP